MPYNYTYIHTAIHTSIHPYLHTYIPTCLHPSIHPSIYTYIQTYHIHVISWLFWTFWIFAQSSDHSRFGWTPKLRWCEAVQHTQSSVRTAAHMVWLRIFWFNPHNYYCNRTKMTNILHGPFGAPQFWTISVFILGFLSDKAYESLEKVWPESYWKPESLMRKEQHAQGDGGENLG